MGRRLDPRFKRLSGCELDYWTIFTKVNQRVNGGRCKVCSVKGFVLALQALRGVAA
jgi:hypothetical protein